MKLILAVMCCLGAALCSSVVTAENNNNLPDQVFDKYGDISWGDETAHLDNFAIALLHDPNLIGYIAVYAGRRSCKGEARARAIRAKKYLVERRGIGRSRVLWIDAGYLEETLTVLQPAERGADIKFPFYPSLSSKGVQIRNCKATANRRKKSGRT